jgi:hypothetical protein
LIIKTKNLEENISRIILNPKFPDKKFIDIAKEMRLTDVIGLKGNLGAISHKLRKIEKNSTVIEVLIKDFQEVDQKII